MTGSIVKNLVALALSGISVAMMWLGNDTLLAAQREFGSTFQSPTRLLVLSSFYFVLSGAVFTIVLTHRSKKDRHISYLLSAAVAPLVVIVVPLLWYEGVDISMARIFWILSPAIQAAAAVILGSILTTVLWRLIGKITPDAGA